MSDFHKIELASHSKSTSAHDHADVTLVIFFALKSVGIFDIVLS